MIPRSRRLATLPARRGMRAPRLRCRIPDELEEAAAAADTSPGAAVETSPGAAPPPPDGPESSASAHEAAASPAIVRPAFGHPTF